MPSRTLLTRAEVDIAQRGHNCQANGRHRIEKGDVRLKIRKERSWEHYCVACGSAILARDAAKLSMVQANLRDGTPTLSNDEDS